MKTTSLITITLIAGVILLVTGTSIEMAFAQANQGAPGQNNCSLCANAGEHRNPSDGLPPPGQATAPPVGNTGQCLKAGFPAGNGPADCMPRS